MIEIDKLCFSYTRKPFVRDVSFSVGAGEIFGFLGPSGAGKSTIQKILIGLLPGYTGSVKVFDREVRLHGKDFYERIGVDFEYPSLYEKLTARENLSFFSSLYSGKTRSADELLEAVGLLQDGDKKVASFSKGMKSRLNFIKSLVHNPEILFLDEPTSGLDPTNARMMKELISAERDKGVTVIITTHNMEDAAQLCDRVAFIVDGQVRALDSPHSLIMQRGAATLSYTYLEKGRELSGSCPLDAVSRDELLSQLIKSDRLLTAHTSEPDLGDIFMDVTGRRLS